MNNLKENLPAKSGYSLIEWAGIMALLLSLAGLANQYWLLARFGISFSDFADIDDFLVASINLLQIFELAGIKDIVYAVLFFVLLFSLPYLIFELPVVQKLFDMVADHVWKDVNLSDDENVKPKHTNKANFKHTSTLFASINAYLSHSMAVLAIVVSLMLFSYLVATKQFESIKTGKFCSVDVEINSVGKKMQKFSEESVLYPITGLNSAYFFLEVSGNSIDDTKSNEAVHVIPTSNISFIRKNTSQECI